MKNKYNMTREENIFVAKRILVDSIYKSANLEGIAVTYAETIDILNNVNVAKMRPDEITAVINLRSAWHFVLDNLDRDMDLGFIKECHIRVGHGIVYPLGEFRTTTVAISGTRWRRDEPDTERYHKELMELKKTENATERSIEMMLWTMRNQMFLDGNKRVATIIANYEMVRSGCGVLSVPIELDGIFKTKLVQYYESDDNTELKQFIYDNCIDGVDFQQNQETIMEDDDRIL